jgi:hypothetical protein
LERTKSKSTVENIIKNDDDTFTIVLTYVNKGIVGHPNFQTHYGTNILNVIDNEEGLSLDGEYYTNRIPQTKGRISVKFISKKLKNHF